MIIGIRMGEGMERRLGVGREVTAIWGEKKVRWMRMPERARKEEGRDIETPVMREEIRTR